jgi:hypothetical protein
MYMNMVSLQDFAYLVSNCLQARSVFFVRKFPKASEEDTHCS